MAKQRGVIYGPKADRQIQKTVREVARRMRNEMPQRGRYMQPQRHLQCRLTQDLLAAVDSWTDPSTATAHVYQKLSGDDMQWNGDTITIVNRFENISVDAGTYCKAEWIDGEWQLYAADCPATFSQSSLSASVSPSASVSIGGP